jgi:hypothetical protein
MTLTKALKKLQVNRKIRSNYQVGQIYHFKDDFMEYIYKIIAVVHNGCVCDQICRNNGWEWAGTSLIELNSAVEKGWQLISADQLKAQFL